MIGPGSLAARCCRRRGGLRRWPEAAAALLVGVVAGILVSRSLVAAPSKTLRTANAGASSAVLSRHDDCPPTAQALGLGSARRSQPAVVGVAEAAASRSAAAGDANAKKKLLLVGVMTAQKFIDSRAAAVHNTWARSIPGDVLFFSSEGTRTGGRFRAVALPGVDDTYPPQKKSFMMLKYMHDHYAHQYHWFMRVDDDVYVKGDRLATFLHSINGSRPLFIGQSGQGSKDELGQLSLNRDENFCMGGPGMLFSAPTLHKVAPHIADCLQSLYTTHEDVEVGRCVRRFAGVQCTWSFEMPSLFYHNYGYKDQTNPSFPAVLLDKNVEPAITLHPVKTPENMYRVHSDVLLRRSRLLRHRVAVLTREMRAASTFAASTHRSSDSRALLREERLGRSANSEYSRLHRHRQHQLPSPPWETFTSKGDLYSLAQGAPRRGLPKPLQPFFRSIQWQASEILNKYAEHRGGSATQLTQLHRGFWQPPTAGEADVRVMLDVQLSYQRSSGRRSVRRQLFVRVPLGEPEVRSASIEPDDVAAAAAAAAAAAGASSHLASLDLTENGPRRPLEEPAAQVGKQLRLASSYVGVVGGELAAQPAVDQLQQVVAMILPLSGRPVQLSRFLRNYERVCLQGGSNSSAGAAANIRVRLLIVSFASGDPNDDRQLSEHVESLRVAYGHEAVDLVRGVGRFSRGRALQLGASRCAASDLLLFIDVDIEFDGSSLRRAVEGARSGVRAFFPVVFSQYRGQLVCGRPHCDSDDRGEAAGFFRHYGFGVACIFKQDFDAVGGFNLTIEGWGREDVDVYDGVARSGLDVFRAPDHALVHVYHPMTCGTDLSAAQARMCRGSLTSQLASVRTLFDTLEKLSWSTNETSRRTVSP